MAAAISLDRAGVPEAAGVLARALADDPGWRHVFPADGSRVARMHRMLRLMIAGAYVSHGASLAVPGAAAAIWTPPGAHDVPLTAALALAPRLAWQLGRRTPHAIRLYRAMTARTPREPHYETPIPGGPTLTFFARQPR